MHDRHAVKGGERGLSKDPAIGKSVVAAGLQTNYHECGDGLPVILLHGSGPGVSAWANWSRIIPRLADDFRIIAPDIAGYGYTERKADTVYGIKLWVGHLLGLLDALEIDKANLVGNSFGGGLSLAATLFAPDRVDRLVLMGTPAGTFEQTPGLRSGWEYEPSLENMERMLKMFPYDKSIVTDEMVRARYEASAQPGAQEAFRKLIPEPNKDGPTMVKGVPEESLRTIDKRTLVLHGREDEVVPLDLGLTIHRNVPDSEIHVFGHCGHWVHVEREEGFLAEVRRFLRDGR